MADEGSLGGATQALVCGPTGFLGSRTLAASGGSYAGLVLPRITSREDVEGLRERVRRRLDISPAPTLINCLGMRSGDEETMRLLNAEVPAALADVASELGFHLIHLGSAAEVVIAQAGTEPSAYQESKRRGTEAVLEHPMSSVLRIYNLHGLPHQESSGLHAPCRALKAVRNGDEPPELFNTVRDYVHWSHVISLIQRIVDEGPLGLVEAGSGFGIAMADVLDALPADHAPVLAKKLLPPDRYSAAVSSKPFHPPVLSREELVFCLAGEVSECASS